MNSGGPERSDDGWSVGQPGWSIGELAEATGLTVRVLRHWDEIGIVSPPRTGAGHRRYRSPDLIRLYRAVALRRTGLGLERVRALLAETDPDPTATLRQHLTALEDDIRQRSELRDRLRDALAEEATNGTGEPTYPAPLMKVIAKMTLMDGYVHGYRAREGERLRDQATILAERLHRQVRYAAGERVLEIGCGVGAQTVELLRRNPEILLTGVDRSESSLSAAKARVATAVTGQPSVVFRQADVYDLPHREGPLSAAAFDHVFVCFLLEHLARPVDALRNLRQMIRPGGTITVIEGDHGSTRFHPDSAAARRVIDCQVRLQAQHGGDALIGPKLPALLVSAGFYGPTVEENRIEVDADASPAELVDGFIRNTFTAMIAGVREPAVAAGLIEPDEFDVGIADLLATAEPGGWFSYTFTVARATRVR